MRPLTSLLVACLVLLGSGSLAQRQVEPFVPVGVAFADVPSEWQLLRERGFNTITAVLRWPDAEPERGQLQLDRLERTLDRAASAQMRVTIRLDTASAPAWLMRQYPDARFVAGSNLPSGVPSRLCFDHPDVRDAALQFVQSVVRSLTPRAWTALDLGSNPQAGFCSCPYTERRYREWSSQFNQSDRAAFVRAARRQDLQMMVQAAERRGPRSLASHAGVPSILQPLIGAWPGQDDWHMAQTVDTYGGVVGPGNVALSVDALSSATRERGWSMTAAPGVRAGDARLLAWSAVSRGATALTFGDHWRDGPIFANVLTRNPGLFLEVRPRPAQVAVVVDPLSGASAAAEVHRAFLARNIPVDFLHQDDVGLADKKFHLVVRLDTRDARTQAADALAAYAKAGLSPDVRIDGGDGLVETRFLESSNVLMLVGLNYSDGSQRVTMTFAPETQEAIWQNMETGAGVNFIAGPQGPTYSYWFRPRDALVLLIRKDIR